MANEPKPPAHDRLTTYAAERRRQMDVPWALPPDARHVLLAAVERHFGTPEKRVCSRWLWWLCAWPRWGWAVAVLVVLTASGALWLAVSPPFSTTVKMARQDARVEGSPAMTAPSPAPAAQVSRTPALTTATPSAPGPVPASQPPSQSPKLQELAMRSRPTPAAGTTLDDRPAASSVAMMPAQPKAVAPGRAATAATTTSESTTGRAPASQSFARVVPRADPKQASRDTDRLPLLDRFRIESGGNQLRIIDADGSVYEGIMLASAPTQGPPDTKGAGTLARRVEAVPTSTNSPSGQLLRYGLTARSARREEPVTSASDATSPAVDELAFEASGTNRSTSQSVRIEGRFVLNQSPDVGPAPAALSTNRSVELLQFLFQNSVVRGQAVLGNHQAIAIDAAPVGP